jgi:hypothetical protein
MSVTGSKREATQFSDEKMIGIGEFEVLEFNKELDSDGKEIDYTGESREGNPTFRVAVTVKEVKSGKYFPLSFFLEDKEVTTKDGAKFQYINEIGRTSYAEDEANLSEKFKAFPYRKAKVGEAEVVGFLDAWLDIDRSQPYTLDLDWKALRAGSVKELRDLQKTDLPRTIMGMATVRVSEKDGQVKEYQQIYNRNILPGYNTKFFRTTKYTEEMLENIREKNRLAPETKKWPKSYEKFAIDVTDPQFGIKDAYYLGMLKVYTPEEHLPAGEKVLDETDASY